jgi:hypothetical protein
VDFEHFLSDALSIAFSDLVVSMVTIVQCTSRLLGRLESMRHSIFISSFGLVGIVFFLWLLCGVVAVLFSKLCSLVVRLVRDCLRSGRCVGT